MNKSLNSLKREGIILGTVIGLIKGDTTRRPMGLRNDFNWAYNPNYNHPKWAYRGYPGYKSVIILGISSY